MSKNKEREGTNEPRAGTPSRSGTPAADRTETAPAGTSGGNKGVDTTDIHALDDAVGIAGVDLNAEEEAIRASNYNPRTQQQQAAARARVKPQLILDEQALKDQVLRIAASFHLKNLESDSLPMIGLAVQIRMRSLVEQMVEAKKQRVAATHHRPPPMQPPRFEGDLPAPMWDEALYDDVEKILSTIDRVEREEERQARKSRLVRDHAEQLERERRERAALVGGDDSGEAGDQSMASFGPGTPGGPSSVPGTPGGTGTAGKKDKKRKRETPAQTAKNMSEDVRRKLSDQTASRTLGTKKFSWLTGGGGDSPLGRKALPRPKFPPLPPSNLSISSSLPPPSFPSLTGLPTKQDGAPDTPLAGLARLTSVPGQHDATKDGMADDPSNQLITIRDAIHVMEQERGAGAGVGSGTRPLAKAMLNRT